MITGIIQKWGRTGRYSLRKLGESANEDLSPIIDVLSKSKEMSSTDLVVAQNNLLQYLKEGMTCFNLSPDRKRKDNPYRIGLLAKDLIIEGVPVQIQGDEPHNGSSLIRLDEADFAFAGLDELLIHNQQYMGDHGKWVKNFGNHNYQLSEPTDVLVAGSAGLKTSKGLQDFIGMFLIGNKFEDTNLEKLAQAGTPIFVKGRYEGIVLNAYPNARTVVVENVEDAVASTPNSYGIELVQTGSSIRDKNLVVYGRPLFLSETLLVVNYGHYQRDPDLQKVVESIKPQGFYGRERVNNFVEWYVVLEEALGESWINKPCVEDMFVTDEDIGAGVRPYTMQSRGWKASDTLPPENISEQRRYINERRRLLSERYFQKISGGISSSEMLRAVGQHLKDHPEVLEEIAR